MMKKEMWSRTVLGMVIGIAISQIIALGISYAVGGTEYEPCVPELTAAVGSELTAVLVQTLLSVALGALCGAASVIWNIESWSLVRQTGTYFAILLAGMIVVGYFAYWMPRDLSGVLRYVLIFAVIFAFIWIVEYVIGRRRVRELNEELAKTHEGRK